MNPSFVSAPLPTLGAPVSQSVGVEMNGQKPARKHLLTVALEDYFQVGAFNCLIQRGQWYRFETRLEPNTRRVLDLLDRHGIQATFFVLGWVADRYPELVRLVAERGHEVASKGYYHRGVSQMTPEEFRDDLRRAREAIEHAAGKRVLGYRVAHDWLGPADLWALDVLADEGYAYDSSIAPILRRWATEPFRRFAHRHEHAGKTLWEFPISSTRLFGLDVPIAGGNWFRQLPQWLVRPAVDRWHRTCDAPLVMYFHVWELDPEQPTFSAASLLTRVRHYRNLGRMEGFLEHYFRRYSFTGVANYLGLSTDLETPLSPTRQPVASAPEIILPEESGGRTPVSVVVPCFNEELILPYLANTLRSVQARLGDRYDLRFLFVDDGSQDGTWAALRSAFGSWPNAALLRHERNRGVAAAVLTGIRNAPTEIVCSIDCDCTYDPHALAELIPLLTDNVDLVTASPYHPGGQVRNVPGWRLLLSRGCSWLYRRVLHHKLHTYTSCFRVYRRSALADVELTETGYLGIAEMLGRLDLHGGRIVEHPATLEVRMLGRSKMKTLRTILGHLKLLTRLAWLRSFVLPSPPLGPGRLRLSAKPQAARTKAGSGEQKSNPEEAPR